ncbi:hypothetical protein MRB53_039450 [Persea americana]|nr:hypothetical protein MRB53_039450 [Persea americana]
MEGPLKDYDAARNGGNINVPTMLLSGRHDCNSDAVVRPWFEVVPDVRWAILENSAHMSSLDEPERYSELLIGFLLP